MKILKKERKGNRVNLEVEVDYPRLEQAIARALEETAKEIKIPGFRKGKVPPKLVESRINREALVERGIRDLIVEIYPEVTRMAQVEAVDSPEVNIIKQEEGKPLVFTIGVDVYPEVNLGKYKGLKVKRGQTQVGKEEIDRFLEELRERYAEHQEVKDRGVAESDLVELNIVAPGFTRPKMGLIIGQGQITTEFDKELMGLTSGSKKEFKIKMPKDFPSKEMANKEINFKVTVNRIIDRKLPPLDDELAHKAGGVSSLEKFKEVIKERMEAAKLEKAENQVKNELVDKVSEGSFLELPPALIRRETELMIDELRRSLEQGNLTLEDYLKGTKKTIEELKEELKGGARKRAKAKVVLKAIAQTEGLMITEEDFENEIKDLASSMNQKPEEFRKSIGEAGTQYISDYLLRRKALDLVVAKAKISSA